MYTKKTKIVCTLGPSSDSVKELSTLVEAGMDVARLNFSHGTHENHLKIITNLRIIEKKYGKRIAIMQDLQGPKVRIGKVADKGLKIAENAIFKLDINAKVAKQSKKEIIIPIQYKGIVKDSKKGDLLLINDGFLAAEIMQVQKNQLICKAKNDGIIKSGNGVNLTTNSFSLPAITEKDKADLKFGLENNVDFVALSFVKNAKDIEQLRKLIRKEKKDTHIVAKIERHEAVKHLKSIIKATDAVMVARGDLGVDVPPEQVPIIQKRMIALANQMAKPIITATQVLQSMVTNPRATRAEISDAANAVYDHTDALMLSNESAVGHYAPEATATLRKVAESVEQEMLKHEEIRKNIEATKFLNATNAACKNACELAVESNANFIVIFTKYGFTARQIAKYRPITPILTITPHEETARRLCLVWGINQTLIANVKNKGREKIKEIITVLKEQKQIQKRQKLVIIANAGGKDKIITTYKV